MKRQLGGVLKSQQQTPSNKPFKPAQGYNYPPRQDPCESSGKAFGLRAEGDAFQPWSSVGRAMGLWLVDFS